jgi:hypothetical protein
MNVIDSSRIGFAVIRYDFWLDLHNVPGRRRRDLRRELRSNLQAATASVGSRAAVTGLGSIRRLAAESRDDRRRPRWSMGLSAMLAAAMFTVVVEFFHVLAWVDGVRSVAPTGRASGSLTFFPGSALGYDGSGTGFEVSISPGWLALAIGGLTGLIVARPWRAIPSRPLGRRHRSR